MTTTARRLEKNREAVVAWTHPIGTPVWVKRANGNRLRTVTWSTAFLLDGAHAFIRVRGIPGNTRLARVKVAKQRKKA